MTGRRTDKASRLVDASPGDVFAAFAHADALARWLPPEGATAEMEAFEFHVGGPLRLVLHFDGGDNEGRGKTDENSDRVDAVHSAIAHNERIVWDVRFDSDDEAFAGTMTMEWRIKPKPGGTRVDLVARDVPPGIDAKSHAQGLKSSLANLAAFVER